MHEVAARFPHTPRKILYSRKSRARPSPKEGLYERITRRLALTTHRTKADPDKYETIFLCPITLSITNETTRPSGKLVGDDLEEDCMVEQGAKEKAGA
jgi:hypothetical protein